MQESPLMAQGSPTIRFSTIIAAVCLAAAASASFAQEAGVRIGFVNTERLLRDAAPAKASQQKLEQEFSKRDKELQELAARLKSIADRLERDAAVIAESDRQRRQREYAELEKDFQRKQREFREDLNQRRNEELAQVIERANRVIKQIAEQENYDVILQEAVFASPRVDITDKVLRSLAAGGK